MDPKTASGTGATTPPAPTASAGPRQRVHGIDGLRAVAALWVVLFHMWAFSGGPLWPGVDFLLRSGSTGVSLFLVLSGLCLYLPFAGGRTSRFRVDDFFRRRVRRLLPAYYASLVAVVVATLLAGGRFGMTEYSAGEMAAQIGTHLTLTHQLFPETFYGLNGAYWSLGLEWELYLTLPLLIAAAVRFGLARTVAAVVGVTALYRLGLFASIEAGWLDPQGLWATAVLPNFFLGRWSEFALGMVAAEWYRTRGTRIGWRQGVLAALAVGLALAFPDNPLNHILYGVFFFTLVCIVLEGDNIIARVFSWRPLVAIGVMSYSLYLVHQPMIEVMAHVLGAGQGTDPRVVFGGLLALFPIVLLAALGLFALVERRSLSKDSSSVPVRDLLLPEPEGAPRRATAPAPTAGPALAASTPLGEP